MLTIVGAMAGCGYVVRQVPPFCRELINAIRAIRSVIREWKGEPPSTCDKPLQGAQAGTTPARDLSDSTHAALPVSRPPARLTPRALTRRKGKGERLDRRALLDLTNRTPGAATVAAHADGHTRHVCTPQAASAMP